MARTKIKKTCVGTIKNKSNKPKTIHGQMKRVRGN